MIDNNDLQVMHEKKMPHLAKSSTVSVRFPPEILNGNLSVLYVVSFFSNSCITISIMMF